MVHTESTLNDSCWSLATWLGPLKTVKVGSGLDRGGAVAGPDCCMITCRGAALLICCNDGVAWVENGRLHSPKELHVLSAEKGDGMESFVVQLAEPFAFMHTALPN